MTDAPETIWAKPGMPGYVTDGPVVGVYDVEYRRADLPATDAQIKANPKVQALKRHMEMARLWLYVGGRFDLQGIDAALAALEKNDDRR